MFLICFAFVSVQVDSGDARAQHCRLGARHLCWYFLSAGWRQGDGTVQWNFQRISRYVRKLCTLIYLDDSRQQSLWEHLDQLCTYRIFGWIVESLVRQMRLSLWCTRQIISWRWTTNSIADYSWMRMQFHVSAITRSEESVLVQWKAEREPARLSRDPIERTTKNHKDIDVLDIDIDAKGLRSY